MGESIRFGRLPGRLGTDHPRLTPARVPGRSRASSRDAHPCGQPAPGRGLPETANVMVTPARVAAVLQRVAADLDELARARRISDLWGSGATGPAGRTPSTSGLTWHSATSAPARSCPPPARCSCNAPGTPGRTSGTAAGRPASALTTPTTRSDHTDQVPAPAFSKLNAIAVFLGPFLPAPRLGAETAARITAEQDSATRRRHIT
jgi:hypothetical protein